MEDPRHLLQWLASLPNLRIAYVKPLSGQPRELVLPTKSLLDLRQKIELLRAQEVTSRRSCRSPQTPASAQKTAVPPSLPAHPRPNSQNPKPRCTLPPHAQSQTHSACA